MCVSCRARAWAGRAGLRVAADLNAVPPLGIEGIEVTDDGVERDGVTTFGALGVGGLKMKIHKACIARLFERNDLVLDAETIADLAREIATLNAAERIARTVAEHDARKTRKAAGSAEEPRGFSAIRAASAVDAASRAESRRSRDDDAGAVDLLLLADHQLVRVVGLLADVLEQLGARLPIAG